MARPNTMEIGELYLQGQFPSFDSLQLTLFEPRSPELNARYHCPRDVTSFEEAMRALNETSSEEALRALIEQQQPQSSKTITITVCKT